MYYQWRLLVFRNNHNEDSYTYNLINCIVKRYPKKNKKVYKLFKYVIFLEMLGNDNRLALQESFTGESLIDKVAHHYLKFHFPDYYSAKFWTIIGNDETV